MKALSSQIGYTKTAYIAGIGALAIAAILLLSIPIMASAAGTAVDVNATSVYGKTVTVTGMVIPNPGANQEVSISVTAPDGANVLTAVVPVSSATGAFNYTATAGGSSHWVNGTYTVNAIWGTVNQAYSNTTTFAYGTFSSTTTTSSSSATGSTVTTIFSNTTISSITTVSSVTTVISGTTLTSVTTVVSSIITTITSGGSNSTALYIGIVGVIIAVIAGALAAMALRKH